MCKRLPNNGIELDRYKILSLGRAPGPATDADGGVLSQGHQTFLNGVVTCRFNLSGFTTQASSHLTALNKLSQSASYYPIFAVGELDGDSK